MVKLQILIENTLDDQDRIMTSYKKFLSEIVEKESEKEGKVQYFYQDVKLKKFKFRILISEITMSRLFVISPTAWKSISFLYMSHHYLNIWLLC